MTPTGFEPVLPPWKGDVLTAWPWSHNILYINLLYSLFIKLYSFIKRNSPSWARTNNPTVNSRVLYHWAIEDYLIFALFSSVCDRVVALPLSYRGWFGFLYFPTFYGNPQKEPLWSPLFWCSLSLHLQNYTLLPNLLKPLKVKPSTY